MARPALPPSDAPVPGPVRIGEAGAALFDVAATRTIEAAAAAALPPHTLMQRAGLAVARLALALRPHAGTVHVLAGPGNNGGDGVVAATHLHRAGRRVHVQLFGDAARRPADAAAAYAQAQAAGVPMATTPPPAPAALLVDALLGIGATRAPSGAIAEAIAGPLSAARAAGTPVLAVDLPTGLDADTGARLGAAAVRATHTIALLALKPGLFTADGRDHTGEVWLDTLGVAAAAAPCARLFGADDAAAWRPARDHAAHKGRFGDVLVVGGAAGMAGALRLAAHAALAAGAGRVFAYTLDPAQPADAALRPELMALALAAATDPATLATRTVVCGCGGGGAVRELLPPLLAHAGRLVLDADALNAIAADASLRTALAARAARGLPSVLTPHPLEAARLLACSTTAVQAARLASAQALADEFGCSVVLKGSGSVVAAAGATPFVNASGNALLAAPGTGDVLAGWLGGLWAQHAAAPPQAVAAAAVWRHGHAADLAAAATPGLPAVVAGELVEAMRRAG